MSLPKAWIDCEDAGAHQERAEQAHREGGDDQRRVPDLQHERFSCTMIECRKAVPSRNGISAAFSTGSQAQ